jgi:uncharacterized SAM-binding protein YcdF (DUF218 family)
MTKGKNRKDEPSAPRRIGKPNWSSGPASSRWVFPARLRGFVTALGLSLLALPFVLTLNPTVDPIGAILLVFVGGLLGAHPVPRRVLYGAFGAMALLVAVAVFTPALEPLEHWLDVSEHPQNADAIVILGGGIQCGSNELASNSLARLVRGLELWRQGFAPRVTVSEAGSAMIGPSCGDVSSISRRTIGRLYPDGGPEIIDLPRVKTTRDEAEAAARIAKARGWKRVLVVTSPTHTRRARATFRDVGITAIMVSSSEPRYDTDFRLPYDRWFSLEAVARELAGLLKYGANGWL